MRRICRALVVGIDGYAHRPMRGCVADAEEIAKLLQTNGEGIGGENFAVDRHIQDAETDVTAESIQNHLDQLFSDRADIVLFYFAGHGDFDKDRGVQRLIIENDPDYFQEIRVSDILSAAENSKSHIRSIVVILDCCQSGGASTLSGLGKLGITHIPEGTTILSASGKAQSAKTENRGRGVFTTLLIDALEGGAADILGRITPASIYTHIDQALGSGHQRPVYQANVSEFITLRQVSPKVPREVLLRLGAYFPKPEHHFPLDPSFEPDRQNVPEEFRQIPVNEENVRIFKDLQLCNRHSLVEPVDAEHMYYAAINSKACALTRLGQHYWKLAIEGQF